jgi:ribonuclease HI
MIEDGSWIIGFSGFLGISINTFAEFIAALHSLDIARDHGCSHIQCYFNSKIVVDVIFKDFNSFHCYAVIIASIKDCL